MKNEWHEFEPFGVFEIVHIFNFVDRPVVQLSLINFLDDRQKKPRDNWKYTKYPPRSASIYVELSTAFQRGMQQITELRRHHNIRIILRQKRPKT